MVRSYNCFACNRRFGNTCSARWSKWESFIIIGLVMYVFRKVCMGIQAGIEDTEVWDPCFLLWKTSDNLRHRSPVPWGKGLWDHCCLETLQWGLWRYLRLGDDKVTVLDAGRTDETDLEFQRCHETRSFVFARKFIWAWVLFCAWNKSKTNNLYKPVFDVFFWRQQFVLAEAVAKFLLEVSNDTQWEMRVQPHIFHLKEAQRSQAWFKQESKQRTGNKLRLCCFLRFAGAKVGTWERRTVCLSGRFFSCVVGFFALAADPRVFALRRVGNLGLWIFTW